MVFEKKGQKKGRTPLQKGVSTFWTPFFGHFEVVQILRVTVDDFGHFGQNAKKVVQKVNKNFWSGISIFSIFAKIEFFVKNCHFFQKWQKMSFFLNEDLTINWNYMVGPEQKSPFFTFLSLSSWCLEILTGIFIKKVIFVRFLSFFYEIFKNFDKNVIFEKIEVWEVQLFFFRSVFGFEIFWKTVNFDFFYPTCAQVLSFLTFLKKVLSVFFNFSTKMAKICKKSRFFANFCQFWSILTFPKMTIFETFSDDLFLDILRWSRFDWQK